VKIIAGNGYFVFTTNGETPVSGFSKMKKRLDELMKEAAEIDGAEFSPWRLHDLRRTFSTTLNESPPQGLGIPPHIVEALLNHISGHRGGVAGTYNLAAYQPEKKLALERWAAHLQGIVSYKKDANEFPLKNRRWRYGAAPHE
jgi:integrase